MSLALKSEAPGFYPSSLPLKNILNVRLWETQKFREEQPPARWEPGASPQGVKRLRRDADYSSPFHSDFKNSGAVPQLLAASVV
jgi:hypothetical protein